MHKSSVIDYFVDLKKQKILNYTISLPNITKIQTNWNGKFFFLEILKV